MIKADIVSRLAERMGITKVKAEMAFDSFLDALRQAMKRESGSNCAASVFL